MTAHIHNEAAYNDAVRKRIRENALKGRRARWLAENETRQELVAWLGANARAGFLAKMLDSLGEWGSLTAAQENAVRKCRADSEARNVAADAGSEFIGMVGERREFSLIFKNVTGYDTDYGTAWLHRFTDEAGNVVIYKGTKRLDAERGAQVTFKATVKRHDEYKGVKRTMLSRPIF